MMRAPSINWGTTARTDAAEKKESAATAIVRLVREAGCELWHTPMGDAYITIRIDDHREHHPLSARGCRDYLSRLYFAETGKAPNGSGLQDAINVLSGEARFDGEAHAVHVRVAGHQDAIYLDLCDPQWRAVEITRDGWQVVTHPPVRFRRPRGLLSLPEPARGGSLTELRKFVNVATDDDFVLVVAWKVAALRSRGPFPILIFMAEQGAAKTTTTRVLRRLSDPNDADVRRPPRNTEDLMIAATNGHIVAFDNLSRLSEELSDNLSVLATGGGFAVRQLYTNNEEQIFNAMKPIILNGISQVATRGDLLDRAIVLTLPPILETERQDEATFWQAFDQAHPRILGALLDAVVMGLRRVPDVRLACKPRMADFAVWGVAIEPACPWFQPGAQDGAQKRERFLSAYAGNRQGAVEAILDGDPVVDVVRLLVPWEGTASDLLAELTSRTPEHVTKRKEWFTQPRQVSDALRRLAPGLRRIQIDVTFGEREGHTGRRLIYIEKVGSASSPASPSSPDRENRAFARDDTGDDALNASPENLNDYFSGDAGDAPKPPFSGVGGHHDPGDPVPNTVLELVARGWDRSNADLARAGQVAESVIQAARAQLTREVGGGDG